MDTLVTKEALKNQVAESNVIQEKVTTFFLFSYSYGNTSGRLGKREILW